MAVATAWDTSELVTQDKAHLLHPVSNLHALREHGPLVLVRGEDVFLWDSDGKRYIDAFAGLWNVNVGHGREELAEAAAAQMREVAFVPTFFGLASPPPIELATRLAELFPARSTISSSPPAARNRMRRRSRSPATTGGSGQPEKVKIISRKMALPRHRHGRARGDRHPHLPRGVRPARAGLRPRHPALRLPRTARA